MPKIADALKKIPGIKTDESNKKVTIISVSALAFICLAYILFLLKPTLASLINYALEIRKHKVEIKSLRDDLPFKDRFLKKRHSQEKELAKYEKKLSREKELPLLLESLSKMARNSRVKILGIKPSPGKEGAIYHEVPIRVSAQSGYHEFGAFLSKLENDERYMQVSDLKICANRTGSKRHDIDFVIYAYTFKQSK